MAREERMWRIMVPAASKLKRAIYWMHKSCSHSYHQGLGNAVLPCASGREGQLEMLVSSSDVHHRDHTMRRLMDEQGVCKVGVHPGRCIR